MKKTMTKEDLYAIMKSCEEYNDDAGFNVLDGKMFIDCLIEAGISFDLYFDSDKTPIKPGDMCEFWDYDIEKREHGIFIGMTDELSYSSKNFNWTNCRKIPTEVWEPVPMEDVTFFDPELSMDKYIVHSEKWAKTRVNNGKLEGVRVKKEGVRK